MTTANNDTGAAGPNGLNSRTEIKRGNLTYAREGPGDISEDIFGTEYIGISKNGLHLGAVEYDEETWTKIVNGADPVADGWVTELGVPYTVFEARYYDTGWRAMLLRGAME